MEVLGTFRLASDYFPLTLFFPITSHQPWQPHLHCLTAACCEARNLTSLNILALWCLRLGGALLGPLAFSFRDSFLVGCCDLVVLGVASARHADFMTPGPVAGLAS